MNFPRALIERSPLSKSNPSILSVSSVVIRVIRGFINPLLTPIPLKVTAIGLAPFRSLFAPQAAAMDWRAPVGARKPLARECRHNFDDFLRMARPVPLAARSILAAHFNEKINVN